jgi:hypothetical protein
MHIYQMNEYDWIVAKTLEQAIAFYGDNTTLEEEHELDDEELDLLRFIDVDGEYGAAGQSYTFREAFALVQAHDSPTEPYYFASTEY